MTEEQWIIMVLVAFLVLEMIQQLLAASVSGVVLRRMYDDGRVTVLRVLILVAAMASLVLAFRLTKNEYHYKN